MHIVTIGYSVLPFGKYAVIGVWHILSQPLNYDWQYLFIVFIHTMKRGLIGTQAGADDFGAETVTLVGVEDTPGAELQVGGLSEHK